LQANILQGKAAGFGTAPWWWYFYRVLLLTGPPIGIPGLGLAAMGLWRNRNHVMTWALIPFLLAHLAISHKELRFMFPMLLPVLVMALYGLRELTTTRILVSTPGHFLRGLSISGSLRGILASIGLSHPISPRSRSSTVAIGGIHALIALAIGLNFLLLPARCLLPAEEAIRCFSFLYDASRTQTRTVFSEGRSAYTLWGLETHFYRDANIRTVIVSDMAAGLQRVASTPDGMWLSTDPAIAAPPGMQVRRLDAYLPARPGWSWLTRGERRLYVWTVAKISTSVGD